MKIAMTGSSGMIGSALTADLRGRGCDVRRLVRREPRSADEVRWSPGTVQPSTVNGMDAVIHLAGAGVGDRRWSPSWQSQILDSRVDGTSSIARSIAAAANPPRVLLSASGIGWYGDTGSREVDETAPLGDGFLADVVRRWEAATAPAAEAGTRVVLLRTAVVLTADGGTLGRLLPLFRLGLGARLGAGRQWMSWIGLPDYVAAVTHLLDTDVAGPVNVVAGAVTNAQFTRAVGAAVRRPAVLRVPAFALRTALGGLADEALLPSQRVVPGVLSRSRFSWAHPDLDSALTAALA